MANISSRAWITFDLESRKSVHKFEVVICHSHSTGSYLGEITIYGSNYGSNFYEIKHISNVTYNTYSISYDESNYITLFSVVEHEYKYIKLEMDSKTNSPGVILRMIFYSINPNIYFRIIFCISIKTNQLICFNSDSSKSCILRWAA